MRSHERTAVPAAVGFMSMCLLAVALLTDWVLVAIGLLEVLLKFV
jgi:hypothetical protein